MMKVSMAWLDLKISLHLPLTRRNTFPMGSWDFQPGKSTCFQMTMTMTMTMSNDKCSHQQLLTGQPNALLNSWLLERGPRTRNLSGACSSFSTWGVFFCFFVFFVFFSRPGLCFTKMRVGRSKPGCENAFECGENTRAVRSR